MDAVAAARTLAAERLALAPVGPLADGPRTEAQGYQVQRALHDRLATTHLGHRLGWKIGCTTAVMRDYLGIPSPCAGGLFAGTAHESGAVVSHAGFRRVGVECEIAIAFGRDWPAGAAPARADLAASLAFVAPAIEIVDDRYVDWTSLGAPTLIADDFFAAGHVLGPRVAAGRLPDLATVRGETLIDGTSAGVGFGRDVMGHPLDACAWLIERFGLVAGETVLTGSLVKTVWVPGGARVTAQIDGLGEASVTFN